MPDMKTRLLISTLTLLVGLLVLGFMIEFRESEGSPTPSQGPWFRVHVEKPRSARPFMGFLSAEFEEKLAGHGKLGFDHISPGAKTGTIGPRLIELSSESWSLRLETNRQGMIAPGTRLIFPLKLGEKQRVLSCRPSNDAEGYLQTIQPKASPEIDGHFLVELAICENAKTGNIINWPPAPLTVSGSFVDLTSDDQTQSKPIHVP